MGERVRLHGGPWHGKTVEVQEGRDHFHVVQPVPPLTELPPPDEPTAYPSREGTYSRVHGSLHNYEWDGYTTHD